MVNLLAKIMLFGLMMLPAYADQVPSVSDEILASRGDAVVTQDEFDAAIMHIPDVDKQAFLRDGKRVERVVADLLTKKQLANDAMENGFSSDPTVQLRMTIAATSTLAELWLEHYIENVPDADYKLLALEAYEADRTKYMTKPSIDVSHILISTDDRSDEEAEKLALEVHQKVIDGQDTWDNLVQTYSEDPVVSSNRGSYRSVKAGDMVAPFEKAAFSLDVGEISKPVKTRYGYHIIRKDGMNSPRQQSFEEVEVTLMREQKTMHKNRARDGYLNEIGSYPTDFPPESLVKMLSRYFDEDQLNLPESE